YDELNGQFYPKDSDELLVALSRPINREKRSSAAHIFRLVRTENVPARQKDAEIQKKALLSIGPPPVKELVEVKVISLLTDTDLPKSVFVEEGFVVAQNELAIVHLNSKEKNYFRFITNKVATCTAFVIRGVDADGGVVLALAHVKQVFIKQRSTEKDLVEPYRRFNQLLDNFKLEGVTQIEAFICYDPGSFAKTIIPARDVIIASHPYLEKLTIIQRPDPFYSAKVTVAADSVMLELLDIRTNKSQSPVFYLQKEKAFQKTRPSCVIGALAVAAAWAGIGAALGLAVGFGWAIPLFLVAGWNLIKAMDIIQAFLGAPKGFRAPWITTAIASNEDGVIDYHEAVANLKVYNPLSHEKLHDKLSGLPVFLQEFIIHTIDFIGYAGDKKHNVAIFDLSIFFSEDTLASSRKKDLAGFAWALKIIAKMGEEKFSQLAGLLGKEILSGALKKDPSDFAWALNIIFKKGIEKFKLLVLKIKEKYPFLLNLEEGAEEKHLESAKAFLREKLTMPEILACPDRGIKL
ncbi:MAG: hypothetical protein WCL25_06080, partial [bacterium]